MDHGAGSYRRFLSGDDQGIVDIVRDYKDGLILFLNSYVKNIHTAEELAEDTFFMLVVKRPKYSPKYSFKTWLYTIGRNRALNYLKHQARFAKISVEDADPLLARELNDLERSYIRDEEQRCLHCAIAKLPQQYSEVLYLAYFELLTNQELSRVLKKTPKQISNLQYRAKSALKEILLKEGYEYDEL